jgi:hypothetical protein
MHTMLLPVAGVNTNVDKPQDVAGNVVRTLRPLIWTDRDDGDEGNDDAAE